MLLSCCKLLMRKRLCKQHLRMMRKWPCIFDRQLAGRNIALGAGERAAGVASLTRAEGAAPPLQRPAGEEAENQYDGALQQGKSHFP